MPKVKQSDAEVGGIFAALCRQARAGLNWTRAELAEASGLSEALIKKYESNGPWTAGASAVLRETFRKHGVDVEIDEKAPPGYYRVTTRL